MKELTLSFTPDSLVELSFASIEPGRERQLFGEYFPRVVPVVAEYGGRPMGSFRISDARSGLGQPGMGALFHWPDLAAFQMLHDDARFAELKPIRDDALSLLVNGNFYRVESPQEVTFQEGQEYLLAALPAKGAVVSVAALLQLIRDDGDQEPSRFPAKSVQLLKWNEDLERKLVDAGVEFFRVAMNIPD